MSVTSTTGGVATNTKTVVPIIAHWKILDDNNGKSVGVCYADAIPPFEAYSNKSGFPLMNPNACRCALYSVAMALEVVSSQIDTLKKTGDIDKYFFSIICKHKLVYDTLFELNGTLSNKTRFWAASEDNHYGNKKCVTKVCGFSKIYIANVFGMLDELRELGLGDVFYTPIEKSGTSDILSKTRINIEVDPKKDLVDAADATDKQEQGEEAFQKKIANAKKKEMLRRELLELASTCRPTRPIRKLTKREKDDILKAQEKETN